MLKENVYVYIYIYIVYMHNEIMKIATHGYANVFN